tara:strand:- start:102 stop:653 length:552 start_codon:yes stop_codon:yes gene_type:complete
MNTFSFFHKPYMVYGYYDKSKKTFHRRTRMSSTVKIMNSNALEVSDNVWVWHYSILDATAGIKIGKGTQIGAWVGIFTHSSHMSVRLMGDSYMESDSRVGYINESVDIGEYCFIAAGVKILPGVKIGNGCIVSAGAVVNKSIPSYSIVHGNPAKVVGTVLKGDQEFFDDEFVRNNYFDPTLFS